MSGAQIDINLSGFLSELTSLRSRMADKASLLQEIGEELVDSTKRRFETSTAPDGSKWAENKPSTVMLFLYEKAGRNKHTNQQNPIHGRNGNLYKRFSTAASGKRPLVGATGALQSGINWQIDGDSVLIGSPMEYAATQQFGAPARSLGGNAPWGDIPAREFLGLSDDDYERIAEIFSTQLLG